MLKNTLEILVLLQAMSNAFFKPPPSQQSPVKSAHSFFCLMGAVRSQCRIYSPMVAQNEGTTPHRVKFNEAAMGL